MQDIQYTTTRTNVKYIHDKIRELFGNIDIVYQVYYDYNIDKNELEVYVVHHNDFNAYRIIIRTFVKLEKAFPNVDMNLDIAELSHKDERHLTPALSR